MMMGYEGYFIISPDGINLGSARDENVGETNLLLIDQPEVIARLWAGETAIGMPQSSDVPLLDASGQQVARRPTMFVGAPIVDSEDRPVAILTFRLNPFTDLTRLFRRGRIGRSGETYAFDERGRLISESRFVGQLRDLGILGQKDFALLNIEIRDLAGDVYAGEQGFVAPESREFTKMAESAISGESGYDLNGYRDWLLPRF